MRGLPGRKGRWMEGRDEMASPWGAGDGGYGAGLVHLYCGDGKGKTSAAVGLAVRAAGRGRRVLVCRFLKEEGSGEVSMLRMLPGITVMPCERSFGFVSQMDEGCRQEASAYYRAYLEEAIGLIGQADRAWRDGHREAPYTVMVLDEAMAACRYGMVEEERLAGWIEGGRPPYLEVVMTGRDPSARLMGLADYVSEIRKVRHPFDGGQAAREGIEY